MNKVKVMMNNGIVYAEVYEILSRMDKTTVMKIPVEILNLFKNQRDKNYISRINPKDLFNPNNVEKKTRDIIAWLDLEYWATDEEKKALIHKYRNNEIIAEQKKKEDYGDNYNQIFAKQTKVVSNISDTLVDKNKQICVVKNTWFEKVRSFFTRILNKY